MNSSVRTPSRNSNTSNTGSNVGAAKSQNGPKKAKVIGQMDISSVSLSTNTHPPPRTSILSSNVYQPPSSQQHPQQKHPAPPAPTAKIRSSSSVSVPTTSTKHAKSAPREGVIRIRNGGGSVGGVSGNDVVKRMAPSNGALNRTHSTIKARSEGSVTSSDDGTVSEDSVEDQIQLFSGAGAGGLHVNNLLFGPSSSPSSRAGSAIGSTMSSGPKIASGTSSMGRSRVSSATLSAPITVPKPIRIAQGASIRVDMDSSQSQNVTGTGGIGNGSAAPSTGLLSTSVSSSTSSSSLSWVSSPPPQKHAGMTDRDSTGFTAVPASPTVVPSSNPSQQAPHNPATTAAVAAKQAEENRRTEEAARTRRKIADLEISNTSLLQVNQTLEATIRKQTAEIQELKMRMQSAQFGGDLGLLSLDNPIPLSQEHLSDPNNPDANPEAAGVIHEMTEVERQTDLTFRRLCITIEQMVLDARQALDQSMKPAGVKVLSSFDMVEKEAMKENEDNDAADQSMITNEDETEEHYDDSDNDDDGDARLNGSLGL
ncbi:hypothetical protein BGX34_011029 [Mortierella sp. NVP85]|nr:hypothetical protein BGX34_011029 [Mortierella sp. NVP85]